MTPRAYGSQWGAPRPAKAGTMKTPPLSGTVAASVSTSAEDSDDAEAVAQPLDGAPADEDAAFEGVFGAPADPPGDGGEEALLRDDGRFAGVASA